MKEVLLVLFCYLLGSIPFSYIFSRLLGGVDIRAKGTGNVGATNVLRTLGVKIALASLMGDFLKGVLAAWLGLHFGGEILAALCASMAVVGHCWPIFLGFKGGKGVATSAGLLLVLMPSVMLIIMLTFVTLIAVTRYVSLGSVCGAALLPLMLLFMHQPWSYIIMGFVLSGIVLFRHRENIQRLRKGTEKKINEKATVWEGK
ncbi:MAG: acyl-phosphate glycerol 3-phosphate acyltransferase [Firmicutes bacterium HGW-Firmicutes-15]|nr:MAG: acyl-phosphate glycerol 3-phosphate acyltransferase [Firmicutes bacterium HGW-Firmicutes-15]